LLKKKSCKAHAFSQTLFRLKVFKLVFLFLKFFLMNEANAPVEITSTNKGQDETGAVPKRTAKKGKKRSVL